MTNTSNKIAQFSSINQAVATLLTVRAGRAQLAAQLEAQDQLMSQICEQIDTRFTETDAEGNKLPLVLDLGDGNPRGNIIVKRGDLYFVRGRNSGRPLGSKNRNTKPKAETAPASEAPVRMVSAEGAEPVAALVVASEEVSEETHTYEEGYEAQGDVSSETGEVLAESGVEYETARDTSKDESLEDVLASL